MSVNEDEHTTVTNSASFDEIYEDDTVNRYDSSAYCQKYGDKWKKFASSIRDIPQEDGSIIREYVIEDPSLLEQLSEDEEECDQVNSDKSADVKLQHIEEDTYDNQPIIQQKQQIEKNVLPKYEIQNTNITNKKNQSSNNIVDRFSMDLNESLGRPPLPDSYNNRLNSSNSIPKPAIKQQSSHVENILPNIIMNARNFNSIEIQTNTKSNKTKETVVVEDDVDKEIENIHEAAGQRISEEENIRKSESSETVYEYEIMDENGNIIKLDGGEQLKRLAASVKYIKQPDGTVVKEYILSDPNVIKQIKTQISKANNDGTRNIKYDSVADSNNGNTRIPIQTLFDTAQMPYLTPELNKIFKPQTSLKTNNPHFQTPLLSKSQNVNENSKVQSNTTESSNLVKETIAQPKEKNIETHKSQIAVYPNITAQTQKQPETRLKQIDKNKYEILTKSGNLIQFTITYGNPSTEDIDEIKNAVENIINIRNETSMETRPSKMIIDNTNEPHYENVDNMMFATNENQIIKDVKPKQSYNIYENNKKIDDTKSRMKLSQSCDDLSKPEKQNQSKTNSNQPQNYPSVTKIVYDTNDRKSEADNYTHSKAQEEKRSKSLARVKDIENTSNILPNQKLDNLEPITPEMTEQLILKLLLQQLLTQQQTNPTQLSQLTSALNNTQNLDQNYLNPQNPLSTVNPNQPTHTFNTSAKSSLRRSSAFSNYQSSKTNLRNEFK